MVRSGPRPVLSLFCWCKAFGDIAKHNLHLLFGAGLLCFALAAIAAKTDARTADVKHCGRIHCLAAVGAAYLLELSG